MSVSKFEPATSRTWSSMDTRSSATRKFAINVRMAYKAVSTDRQNISQNVTRSRVLETSEVQPAQSFFFLISFQRYYKERGPQNILKMWGQERDCVVTPAYCTQFCLRWTEKHTCREQPTALKFTHNPATVSHPPLCYYVRHRTFGIATRLGADD